MRTYSEETEAIKIAKKTNPHSLEGKMKRHPNQTYKNLSRLSKILISEWVAEEFREFWKANNRAPEGEELQPIAERVNDKMKKRTIWLPWDETLSVLNKKLRKFNKKLRTGWIPKTMQEGNALASAEKKPKKKRRKPKEEFYDYPEQDDTYYYIAGYTSGGFPYGLTWEEMGLEPWQELDDDDKGNEESILENSDLPF